MSINLIDPETSSIHTNRIFKRSIKNEIVQKWVDKNVDKWLRKRVENAYIVPPGFSEELPQWATENMKKGISVHRFVLSNSSESTLKHINDLFLDLVRYSNENNADLSAYSKKVLNSITHYGVDELFDMANDFYEKLADLRGPQAASRSRNEVFAVQRHDGEEVVIPVGDDGYVWRQVVPRGLKTVAVKLRNCLGGRHYAQGIRSGSEEIWVLVKPDENGEVDDINNICVAMQIGLKRRNIIEVKGESNSVPFEHASRISQFCEKKNFEDPQIKKKYSGFASSNLEDYAQKIRTRGAWEIWVEKEPETTRTHLLGKKLFIKNISSDKRESNLGLIEYLDTYVKPSHPNKTHCINFVDDVFELISDRDSALIISDISEILLPENQKDHVFYSSFYERPVTDFLQSELSRDDFIKSKNLDIHDNYYVEALSSKDVWQERVIYEKSIGDVTLYLLDDGALGVKAQGENKDHFVIVPPTPHTLSVAKIAAEHYTDFPLDFVRWKKIQSLISLNPDVSEEELIKIHKQWADMSIKQSGRYNAVQQIVHSMEDREELFNELIEFDKTGMILSGNIEFSKEYKHKSGTELKYVSPVFGVVPKDILITEKGVLRKSDLNFQKFEKDISYLNFKFSTLLRKGSEYNSVIIEHGDDYKIVFSEVLNKGGSFHHSIQAEKAKDKNTGKLINIITPYNDSIMKRGDPKLQSLELVKLLSKSCFDFGGVNSNSITPHGVTSDVFPMPFLRDEAFFDKKRRNLGTDEYPIIKTSSPSRYFGIIPGEDGSIEGGSVAWMLSVGTDKEVKIHTIFKNGIEHLANSLNNKVWNMEYSLSNDMKEFFQKQGYSVYRGKLLKASNTAIDNFVEGDFVIKRDYDGSPVKRDMGDDRAWKIKYVKINENSYASSKTSEHDTFSIVASSVRSENNKNVAFISNRLSKHTLNIEEIPTSLRNQILKIINEASLDVTPFDAFWLGITKDTATEQYIPDDSIIDKTIDLGDKYYAKVDTTNAVAALNIFDKSDDKRPVGMLTNTEIKMGHGVELSLDFLKSTVILKEVIESQYDISNLHKRTPNK